MKPLTASVALGLLGAGFLLLETLLIRVGEQTLPNPCVLRAVQISDLHGRTCFLNGNLSAQVNRLNPDVVFLTGDLANDHADLEHVLNEIDQIRCPHILFVPGNYERMDARLGRARKRTLTETEYQAVLKQIAGHVTVLSNAGITLHLKGQRLHVHGFDNARYGDERAPMQPWPPAERVVLLAHSPNIIGLVQAHHLTFDALLVGHTHGGQVRLFGRAFDEYRHFRAGRNPTPQGLFYVNRGLGTSRLPFRLGTPPEILVLNL